MRFLRINDTVIWSAPVELFCEITLFAVRARSPFANTFYFGYTNGWFGYLPTAQAFDGRRLRAPHLAFHGAGGSRSDPESHRIPAGASAMNRLHRLHVSTRGKGLYDITRQIEEWLEQQAVRSGLLTVFIQHTSASLTIQENADPDVVHDLNTFSAASSPRTIASTVTPSKARTTCPPTSAPHSR